MLRLRKMDNDELGQQRRRLVRLIGIQGIADSRVLEAMDAVPREAFLPESLWPYAYRDAPLPIGRGQTISQPSTVALMIAALELEPEDCALEVGTGSGYAAAIMGRLCREVFTIERFGQLADAARERLSRLGFRNVRVFEGDGTQGLVEHAPYDAICVAAGGPRAPEPLLDQLEVGGRLVIPVGPTLDDQKLWRIRKLGPEDYRDEELADVRFVPLVGDRGWDGERAGG